jgi:hypothetical protein
MCVIMSRKQKQFECALGCHNYTIPYKNNTHILICENCKRKGYYKSAYGLEVWYDYDDKGNYVYKKDSSGFEAIYDEDECMIYLKITGENPQWWDDEKNDWVNKKPENWKYENYLDWKKR